MLAGLACHRLPPKSCYDAGVTRAKPGTPGGTQLTVEHMRLDALRPDPENSKDHDMGALSESMARFGFVSPVLINEETGLVLAGHGRLERLRQAMAAEEERPAGIAVDADGMWLAPVVRGIRLGPEDGKAYTLADNRLVELGGWHEPKLLKALSKAMRRTPGLAGTGFDSDDARRLTAMLSSKRKRPTATVPGNDELQAKWRVRRGDTWTARSHSDAGLSHRLVCGDSTLAETYERALGRDKADLVYTDPPYGIAYRDHNGKWEALRGDWDAEGLKGFRGMLLGALKQIARRSKPEAAHYVWCAETTMDVFYDALKRNGLRVAHLVIWVKNRPTLSFADLAYAHETCIYAVRQGRRPMRPPAGETTVWEVATEAPDVGNADEAMLGSGVVLIGPGGKAVEVRAVKPRRTDRRFILDGKVERIRIVDDSQTDVWHVRVDAYKDYLHPTQKPVGLALRAIENSTSPGQTVLDPFLGSGATLLACEELARRGVGIELEPQFVAATLERLERAGLHPEREKAK